MAALIMTGLMCLPCLLDLFIILEILFVNLQFKKLGDHFFHDLFGILGYN